MRKYCLYIFIIIGSIMLTSCRAGISLFSTPTPTITPTLIPTPTPQPTSTPTPTPTLTPTLTTTPYSEMGPFQLEYPLDGLLPGQWLDLQIIKDKLWVVSSQGAAWRKLDETAFSSVTWSAEYLGIDQSNRLWVHNPLTGSLSSWDGYQWKDYTVKDGWLTGTLLSRSPLKNVPVSDNQGGTWLATTWGAAHFDGQNWTRYPFYQMGFKSPPKGTVRSLVFVNATDVHVDSPDGTLWAASCVWKDGMPVNEGGLSRFDGTTWSRVALPDLDTCITAIDSSISLLWLATTAGIISMSPNSLEIRSFPDPTIGDRASVAYTDSIQVTPGGEMWPVFVLCTPNGCGQLAVRFHWVNGSWFQGGEVSGFPFQPVVFDLNGNAWFLNDGRISVPVHNHDGSIELISKTNLDAVSGAVDKTGRLWIVARFGDAWGLWSAGTKSINQ
ncbi:MAG: cellulase glycosyl hydrolase family 5 TPS linker domain X [Chloroflexi bacterium]|nr:MAG: cellulase glycosyl hydrolase family 5 TPS linker domain X [Chloroflexota bacterium]